MDKRLNLMNHGFCREHSDAYIRNIDCNFKRLCLIARQYSNAVFLLHPSTNCVGFK